MEKTDPLVKNGYVVCEKSKIAFLDEAPCRVPPKYLRTLMSWAEQEVKRKPSERTPMPTPEKWKY